MFAPGRAERLALSVLALSAFAGAFATTPMIARGAAALPVAVALATTSPAAEPAPLVTPRRDPFAGGIAPPNPTSAPATALPPISSIPPLPALIRPLPPNAGAGGAPFSFGSTHVSAIVAGRRPFALVDDGGGTRVVTVGDALSGVRVTEISAESVRLSDGSTLRLQGEH